MSATVLVLDSGIGGLGVLRHLRDRITAARFVYVADNAAFPYGERREPELQVHLVTLMAQLIEALAPDIVVIACNTASTLVLDPLRQRFDTAFVGTVPAVKPAAARSRSGLVSVLATPATVRRDYTGELIDRFGRDCAFTLIGSRRLARLAEARMAGERVDRAAVRAEILPCFVKEKGRRTDVVVLACTHFPFLLDEFERLAPWPVEWVDPAAAIARHAADVVRERCGGKRDGGWPARDLALFTGGVPSGRAGLELMSRFGLEPRDAETVLHSRARGPIPAHQGVRT